MSFARSAWLVSRVFVFLIFYAVFYVANVSADSSAMVTLTAAGGDGKIDLSWTVSGDLKYVQVYRDTDADPTGRERKAILAGSARSYTDNTVENGRQYWYWIKYTDADGGVGNSNTGSATPASSNSGNSSSVSASGVTVSPTSTTVTVGSTTSLTATVMPSNAANKNVSWRSSASGVASVSQSGVVTGVSPGTATITVTTADGGYSATASVEVLAASAPNDNAGVSSLKSLAAFPIGVAVAAGNENNSIISSGTSSQQQAVAFTHFNQMTAGNIMKMSYLHPSENSFTFDQADKFVSFANANGIAVHGHTLIWHSDYQVPGFMKNYNGDFAAMLKKHVQTIASHYAGKVASWDVVNEALADNNESGAVNGFRNSVFYQKMGVNFIDQAFINARAADPSADLFYNDYSTENGDAKTKNMLSLVDGLKARGVPITGVGFQMHVLVDWPSTSTIESAMRAVADRGLKVKISELDVRVNNPYNSSAPVYTSLTAEAAQRQKERYRQIVAAYLRAVPAAQRAGITVWGVSDADSWLNTPEKPDWPLLFDDNFQSKPALQGFAEGLMGN